MRFVFLSLLLLGTFALPSRAEYFGDLNRKIWLLDAPNGYTRWLILRANVKDRHGDLYHVEILQLKDGKKPWEYERLAAHMALTEQAIRSSLGPATSKGDVYPEAFDNAYAIWKQTMNPSVCTTNVNNCLKDDGKFIR